MHKKGKVKRKRKNKFRTRQLRRQTLFHKKILRMEGGKRRGGDAEGRDAAAEKHRARAQSAGRRFAL
jgi:hypothetical protein